MSVKITRFTFKKVNDLLKISVRVICVIKIARAADIAVLAGMDIPNTAYNFFS